MKNFLTTLELARVVTAINEVGVIQGPAGGVCLLAFEVSEKEMRIARNNADAYRALEVEHGTFGAFLEMYNKNPITEIPVQLMSLTSGPAVCGKIIELTMTTEFDGEEIQRRIYGRYVPGPGHTFIQKKINVFHHITNNADRTINVEVAALAISDCNVIYDQIGKDWFEPVARGGIMTAELKHMPLSGAFIYKRFPNNNSVTKEIIGHLSSKTKGKRVFVLHHADSDGRFAGYAAHRSLVLEKPVEDREVLFFEVQYGKPFPVDIDLLNSGDEMFILDFSYSREVLEKIAATGCKLVVLDHHKSAKEELAGLPYAIFDMTKSGALLAWEWFFPEHEVPMVCTLVNDRDLWAKKYPDSRHLEGYLRAMRVGSDWEHWHKLTTQDSFLQTAIARGQVISEIEDSMINKVFKSDIHKIINFNFDQRSIVAAIYNCPGLLHSEVAEKYYTSLPIEMTVAWRVIGDGVLFSLRSPGKVDCSAIAKQHGGGGHAAAAGFKLSFAEGLLFVKNILNGN